LVQPIHTSLRFTFFAIVALLSLAITIDASAQSVKFSPLERKLITWTDTRDGADSLVAYLRHKDEQIAWRAAIGLANIQDTTKREAIIQAMREERRDNVTDAMCFALGCMGPNEAAGNAVLFQTREAPSVTKLEALGRTITEAQLPKTMQYLVEELKSRSILDALIQVALRNMPVAKALKEATLESKFEDLMARLADHSSEETRWRTAYFYGRLNDSTFNLEHLETIQTLLNDQGEPLSRMFAANALARIHSLQTQNILTRAFRSEREWRVRVNILNALQRAVKIDSTLLAITKSSILSAEPGDPTSEHVATAAFMLLDDMVVKGKLSRSDSADIRSWLALLAPSRELYPQLPVNIRARALPTMARFGGGEEMEMFVLDVNQMRSRFATEMAVQAISIFDDTTGFAGMLASMTMVQPREQLPYIQALGNLWERAKKTPWFMRALEEKKYANLYRRMLIRLPSLNTEAGPVTTVLELLQDSTVLINREFRDEALTFLAKYLEQFNAPEFTDQMNATLSAIRWIGEETPAIRTALGNVFQRALNTDDRSLRDSLHKTFKVLDPNQDPGFGARPARPAVAQQIDWDLLENSSDTIHFRTDRGVFQVRLDKYNAPLTSLNFLKLTKMNYYANHVVHRVVPNFVIQSGDPTASGYGGPGYAIRREVAPARFDAAGKIGMASSGKDTEGSQWFITHLPTPHLDSRYTVFGEVIGGAEVIDKVQLYDRVEHIFQLRY
jgi:cyclophilin family peptidyl-prolyl cis-trans isomerase/HEAT repeat protein